VTYLAQYNDVWRIGAGSGSPVPSYYICDLLSSITVTPVSGDKAYESNTGRSYVYIAGTGWVILLTNTNDFFTILPQVARRDTPNTFTNPEQRIQYAGYARLFFRDDSGAADNKVFCIMNQSNILQIWALNDAENTIQASFTFNHAGDFGAPRNINCVNMAASAQFYEQGRTVPIGFWKFPTFNSANFYGDSGTTWTVTSGQIGINQYTLIGKTLIWNVCIFNSTLSGTASPALYINLPDSLSSSGAYWSGMSAVPYLQDASGIRKGMIHLHGPSTVRVYALDGNLSGTLYALGFTFILLIN